MQYISIESPGGNIWAEVSELDSTDGVVSAADSGKVLRNFQDVTEALEKNARYILDSLQDLDLSEVEITFGMKVGAEAGVPIFSLARASGEASYAVKLVWKKDDDG